jgi:hypothetical protein
VKFLYIAETYNEAERRFAVGDSISRILFTQYQETIGFSAGFKIKSGSRRCKNSSNAADTGDESINNHGTLGQERQRLQYCCFRCNRSLWWTRRWKGGPAPSRNQ